MREITCIICPKGCRLKVEGTGVEIITSGALCKRGETYAIQEITNPVRSLQSTVKTTIPGFKVVAVKTSAPVPLKEIFVYMKVINGVVLKEKKQCGDVIFLGLNGSNVNLILTERLK